VCPDIVIRVPFALNFFPDDLGRYEGCVARKVDLGPVIIPWVAFYFHHRRLVDASGEKLQNKLRAHRNHEREAAQQHLRDKEGIKRLQEVDQQLKCFGDLGAKSDI